MFRIPLLRPTPRPPSRAGRVSQSPGTRAGVGRRWFTCLYVRDQGQSFEEDLPSLSTPFRLRSLWSFSVFPKEGRSRRDGAAVGSGPSSKMSKFSVCPTVVVLGPVPSLPSHRPRRRPGTDSPYARATGRLWSCLVVSLTLVPDRPGPFCGPTRLHRVLRLTSSPTV